MTERLDLRISAEKDITIRRSSDPTELVLSDANISREESRVARLKFRNGQLFLSPSGSENPILVNGEKVQTECALQIGDRIRTGYTVLVLQALDDCESENGTDIKTISLKTSYLKRREEFPAEWDRLAIWAEGFDEMQIAEDEQSAATVILEQINRQVSADRILLALSDHGGPHSGYFELAARGLSAGEIERLLRWFQENEAEPGVHSPTLREVTGGNSSRRVAVGRVDQKDVRWRFYVDCFPGMMGQPTSARCLSIATYLIQLFGVFREQRIQERRVNQLTETVQVCTRPIRQTAYQEVAAKFVFHSYTIRNVCLTLSRAATAPSPVLLMGEPGTGKQVAAEALHAVSNRREKPLVSLSIAEYPENLIEGELFGHSANAFTGAAERLGLIAEADGGTLFLDEVGEIPLAIQAKLLRVLERGEYRRLGENRVRSANLRLISATNRNLTEEIRSGRFRQDLYDRISVIPLVLPPLRERPEDIPLLAESFLSRLNQLMQKQVELTPEGLKHLTRYTWPDNVRGLKNYLERTVALADTGPQRLDPDDLPPFAFPTTIPSSRLVDEVLSDLRNRARANQARILNEFQATPERLTKTEWSRRLGLSLPVFRAELRNLMVHALDYGVQTSFFETRVKLRSEDWKAINETRNEVT